MTCDRCSNLDTEVSRNCPDCERAGRAIAHFYFAMLRSIDRDKAAKRDLAKLQAENLRLRRRAVSLAMRLRKGRAIRTYDRLTYRTTLHQYLETGHTLREQFRALKASIRYDLLYGPKGKLP